MKQTTRWHSPALNQEVLVARWGEVGVPVLLFPTAGGDAEECERFLMLNVLEPMLEIGRIKVYSVDSIAGRAWCDKQNDASRAAAIQNRFDEFLYREVVPAIRQDCQDDSIEVVTAGASLGAFNAVAALCRHPDVFQLAIGMSGTYDMGKFLSGPLTLDHYYSSPLHFLRDLPENEQLQRLRQRFVLLTHGDGRWEEPAQSWRMADVLGTKGIPNRVDAWGEHYDHDWPTWREMLPKYLDEFLPMPADVDSAGAGR